METMKLLETRIRERVQVNVYYSVQIIEVDGTFIDGGDTITQYIGLICQNNLVERVTDSYFSVRSAMTAAKGWIAAQPLS